MPNEIGIRVTIIVTLLLTFGFALIFPIIFIGLGIWLLKQSKRRKNNLFIRTQGQVRDFARRLEHGSETQTYTTYPVIEFKAGEFTLLKEHTTSRNYKIGDIVTVYYNPDNVNDYFLEGEQPLNIMGYIFIFTGILSAILLWFT